MSGRTLFSIYLDPEMTGMEVQTLGSWARSKLVSHRETWSPKFMELLRVFGILLMMLVVGGGLGTELDRD